MELMATHGQEIVLKVRSRIGVVADVARLLADRGLELHAVNGSVDGDNAIIRIVTDDNLRAADMLREHHYDPREVPVILVHLDHRPGMFHRLTERLAEEMIDVYYFYTCALPDQDQCLAVMHTDNDEQALLILNQLTILV